MGISACRDDFSHYATSASDQPSFSVDTVQLDTLFSRVSSSTFRFMVYNRRDVSIRLDRVFLCGGSSRGYRMNVDGRSGEEVVSLTILPRDSMYVLVEATYPEGASDLPVLVQDSIGFLCNGLTSYILLRGYRQNVDIYQTLEIKKDTILGTSRPVLIHDSLVIGSEATLRLAPGCRLLMHSNASISVHGKLISEGTLQKRVYITSERQDSFLPDLPYPLVPGQWQGIRIEPRSYGNELTHTVVSNATNGLVFEPGDRQEDLRATFSNCIVQNMKGVGLRADGGGYVFTNSLFANTLKASMELNAGRFSLTYCSIINFYPWDARKDAALLVRNFIPGKQKGEGELYAQTHLTMTNCIVDGNGSLQRQDNGKGFVQYGELATELMPLEGGLSAVANIRFSYLRSVPLPEGTAINCKYADVNNPVEQKEKRYYCMLGYKAERPYGVNFVYDFRPLELAPFLGMADPSVSAGGTDLCGVARPTRQPTPGAYEPVLTPAARFCY